MLLLYLLVITSFSVPVVLLVVRRPAGRVRLAVCVLTLVFIKPAFLKLSHTTSPGFLLLLLVIIQWRQLMSFESKIKKKKIKKDLSQQFQKPENSHRLVSAFG